jgi:L-iditol 2-dehydrogenase
MNALVKYRRGDGFVEIREVTEPEPGPRQVKIEVRAAGICGSDIHILHDEINIPLRPPVIMGHEFSGVVVDKGSKVDDGVRIGDRVTAEPSGSICGTCRYCRSEHYNLCPERRILGYSADGCFAPYCNALLVHRLPENVSFEAASITELLACCIHGVIEQTGISAGDSVVVLGPGPLGLLASMVAVAEGGIVSLYGTERDRQRLNLAENLGIHRALIIDEEHIQESVADMTDGYGADVVLECSGSEAAASLGLELVRKRGKYTQMGLFGRPITIDFEKIAFKEIRVGGFVSHRRPSWKRALSLMERGIINTEALVSHAFPLSGWHEAFTMVEEKSAVKAILLPGVTHERSITHVRG